MSRISNSNIEWTWMYGKNRGFSWNMGVGCKGGCTIETVGFNCYAREYFETRGKNSYPEMKNFEDVSFIEKNYVKSFPKQPSMIFVNALSDVFYWPPAWIEKMFARILQHPEHIFVVLSKKPVIYQSWKDCHEIPENIWFGATCLDGNEVSTYQDHLFPFQNNTKFLSLEPIREEIPVELFDPEAIDWIIIGGQSGPGKKFYPSIAWVAKLVLFCERNEIPLFFKDNLLIDASGVIQKPTKRYQWPQVKK